MLLTIAIPTFNRLKNLSFLLENFLPEIVDISETVEVLVSNNCSTDGTDIYLSNIQKIFPFVVVLNNLENVGADRNFTQCYVEARGKYFWLLGDDDFPYLGFVKLLIKLVNREQPDVICIKSKWYNQICELNEIDTLRYETLSRERFFLKVNIWLGYISGIVVNKSIVSPSESLFSEDYKNSNLIQLAWVLDALEKGNNFVDINTPAIMATRGNTGGYAALDVFGINLHTILTNANWIKDSLISGFMNRMLLSFYNALVWKVKNGSGRSKFIITDSWSIINLKLHGFWVYGFFTKKIYSSSRTFGFFIVVLSKISYYFYRYLLDRTFNVRKKIY